MIGMREIRRLRRELEARDGAAFDLRRFHDEVIGHGSLPLATLARELPTGCRPQAERSPDRPPDPAWIAAPPARRRTPRLVGHDRARPRRRVAARHVARQATTAPPSARRLTPRST